MGDDEGSYASSSYMSNNKSSGCSIVIGSIQDWGCRDLHDTGEIAWQPLGYYDLFLGLYGGELQSWIVEVKVLLWLH